ncbi:hypothetical protein ZIOFF_035719 [Zingiber officinale]|uniref:Uncharacterized protein n=1 Tax=Zingiber officinale TaxID=94328 RepID=A0A8J5GA15_ZINOF|nr:hypothetical protein ZIOFF_035719 [Zingiber officinale]
MAREIILSITLLVGVMVDVQARPNKGYLAGEHRVMHATAATDQLESKQNTEQEAVDLIIGVPMLHDYLVQGLLAASVARIFRCADDKLKKMALRVIAESLSEEEIAGLKEAIPCDGHQQQRCKIGICVSREEAYDHLTVDGFIKGYTHWVAHVEIACSAPSISSSVLSRDDVDNMEGLVHDAFGVQQHNGSTINTAGFEKDKDIPFGEAEKFYKLIDDSQKELYPGYCQNIQGASNNQIDETSIQKDNDVQGMPLKSKNVGKFHVQLQDGTNTQPQILIDKYTTRNSKKKDCQNIQGASNNQIDDASNQKDIELQASNKIVENDFMDEEFDQDSESESPNAKKKTRGPTFMKDNWGRPSTLPRIKSQCDVVMHATAATDQLESKVNRRLLQYEFGNAVFHPLDPYRPEANPYKPTNSYNRGCNPINHCRSG